MSMEIEQINNLGRRLLEEHSKLADEVFNKNSKALHEYILTLT